MSYTFIFDHFCINIVAKTEDHAHALLKEILKGEYESEQYLDLEWEELT